LQVRALQLSGDERIAVQFAIPLAPKAQSARPGGSDFSEREPAEKLQICHLGQRRLDFLQLIQCFAQARQFAVIDDWLLLIDRKRGDFELSAAMSR